MGVEGGGNSSLIKKNLTLNRKMNKNIIKNKSPIKLNIICILKYVFKICSHVFIMVKKQNVVLSIYRTSEQRKQEVKVIMEKLKELQLSMDYEPIKKLYELMFKYIRTGEKIIVNIQ